MKLVFAGTPTPALPALRALHESVHELAAVVTRPDARSGRGRTLRRSPVGQYADEHGIRVLTPGKASDPEFAGQLADIAPDCCAVVAYGSLIPPPVLAIPAHGWVNLHFSLLPAWRGAAPVQWAVISGDEFTGATTFALEAGMDTGPVFGTVTEPVRPRDTAGELLERLSRFGAELLSRTVDGIADGSLQAQPQLTDGVSLAPKLGPEDAHVDWGHPAINIDRQVRGCTPFPGAWTMLREERLKLGPVTVGEPPAADTETLEPGAVRVTREGVQVGTATVAVWLSTVQPAGRTAMSAGDWARGVRLEPSDRLR